MIRGQKTDDLTHFGPLEVVPEVENGQFEAKTQEKKSLSRKKITLSHLSRHLQVLPNYLKETYLILLQTMLEIIKQD